MEYLKINRKSWDERAHVHYESTFYDVESFKQGKSSLNQIEVSQLGDIKDKSLLHLQCHFGLDTLSLARLGANVTGVDLSTVAIEKAKALSNELGIKSTFVASDVYEFGRTNTRKFDIVFSSYGVLCWLPDLKAWAKVISESLAPGGEFHLVEFHAFCDLMNGYSYFYSEIPDIEEEQTYTENCAGTESTVVTWPHPLSEVINALILAGLSIEHFEEYEYSPYPSCEGLEFIESKGYSLKHQGHHVPLLYAIKAIKK